MYQLPIDYRIEDIDILNGAGVMLPLRGPDARGARVYIGQLTVYQWFYTFLPSLQVMNKTFDNAFELINLLSVSNSEIIEENKYRIGKAVAGNVKASTQMVKVLTSLKVNRWSIKRFMRMVTVEQLIELFILIYLFNSDGVKKKFLSMINLCKVSSTELPTSPSSSTKLGGYQKLKVVKEINSPAVSTPTCKV